MRPERRDRADDLGEVVEALGRVRDPQPDPGTFVQWLGLEMLEASGDKVVAAWDIRPDMLQPYGIVHGGVHCSVIETVASYAAALWFREGQVVEPGKETRNTCTRLFAVSAT